MKKWLIHGALSIVLMICLIGCITDSVLNRIKPVKNASLLRSSLSIRPPHLKPVPFIRWSPGDPLLVSTKDKAFQIGNSAQGRALVVYRFGSGPVPIVLINGIHGGYEPNTVTLAYAFIDLLSAKPELVPAPLSLFIVPVMNPDGFVKVGGAGRVNANGVDLNRNWDCDWHPRSGDYQGIHYTSGGKAFSEPETIAIRDFLLAINAKIVIFYHSQGNFIFYGQCNGRTISKELATYVSHTTGYKLSHPPKFAWAEGDPRPITGEGTDFWDGQGVIAIGIELSTHNPDDIDWEANYQGLLSIFEYAVLLYQTVEVR